MGKTFVYNAGEAKKPAEELELVVGLFFDGTLNNRRNTQIRKRVKGLDGEQPATEEEKKIYHKHATERSWTTLWLKREDIDDTSYTNDYTNVARMSFGCDEIKYGIYIEGIGTLNEEDDVDSGYAFGSGKTGIRGKVRKGCEELAKKIKQAKQDAGKKRLTSISIDAFGFSRGAAAARNFIYEVNVKKEYTPKPKTIQDGYVVKDSYHNYGNNYESNQLVPKYKEILVDDDGFEVQPTVDGKLPKMGHLGYSLLQSGMTLQELEELDITIRFVGLYDTVSSYEEFGDMDLGKKALKGLIHAASGPGHYFSNDVEQLQLNNLGSINKAVHFTAQDEHRENFALTRMPSSAIEKNLPGVHCDIGGAYKTGDEEISEIENTNYKFYEDLYNYRQQLIDEYWYKEKEIELYGNDNATYIRGKRFIKKEYSYIPLHFMEEFCFELMKDNMIEGHYPSTSYPINGDKILEQAKNILHKYVFDNGDPLVFVSDEDIKKRKEEKRKADEKARIDKEFEEDMEKIKTGHENEVFRKNQMPIQQDVLVPRHQPIDIPKIKDPTELEEVVVVGYTDQGILRKLRNEYLHWSANRHGLGMDPTNDYKRVEY